MPGAEARGPRRRLAAVAPWALWGVVLLAVTLLLLAFRARLDKTHVALAFLLVVLGGSAAGGRTVGLALVGVAFLLFNFFFLPPYNTLVIADPLDWLVLVTFLVTSIVAAQLLYRARLSAERERRRAEEIDRLATLGAETLNVGRADQALQAIAEVIRTTLGVDRCEVYVRRDGGAGGLAAQAPEPDAPGEREDPLVEWVLDRGTAAVEREDGTTHVGGDAGIERDVQARALLLPLTVRDRTVGALRVASDPRLALDPAQRRVLAVLSYYAALGVERARLSAEAEHAEALRAADRLKDALLASVSHDLRTPLTTIKALATELRPLGDERVAIIEQEADRLGRFVTDLLDLSRITGGALPLRLELNAADDLIGAAVQQASGILGAHELRVALDRAAPLAVGRFDLVHSVRILVNLLANAVKYSPAGSPIDVSVRRDGDALAIAVADRGPGVALEERSRIFEPFYRPSGAPPDAGSAGLGLAIARRLAELQGGRLSYAPRPDGGSVFTVELPAAEGGQEFL